MMLGRLVRWMRIFGYDVWYQDPVDDPMLIRMANEEKRVLLTRDTRLIRRRGIGEHLLIQENDPMKQLEEVIRVYPPHPGRILTRCIRCNTVLNPVDKGEVRNYVPDYVFQTETKFGRCPECCRVFWKGTHYTHMVNTCRHMIGHNS
jgi:hypothetical protein